MSTAWLVNSAAKQVFLNTVFAHEVAHKHPEPLADAKAAGQTGAVVDALNMITNALGLSCRREYTGMLSGGYWVRLPFASQQVDKKGESKEKTLYIHWLKRNVGGKGVN